MRRGLSAIRHYVPVVGAACVALGFVAQGVDAASASGLASHRAVYDVRLADPEQGSGFSGAQGRIVVEWQDVCTGYTFNSRAVTEFRSLTGDLVLSDRRYSSYEDVAGEMFRFSVENYVNEDRSDGASGIADRNKLAVKYEAPEMPGLELPEETVFPTELTLEIVEAAKKGDKIVRRALFEGTEEGVIFNSVAFIGRRQKPVGTKAVADIKGAERLGEMAYWPVTLSYFELGGAADLPIYEVSYYLYPNGISDKLKLDFGEFKLEANLAEIEFIDKAECSK